jgi:hypothetical protein
VRHHFCPATRLIVTTAATECAASVELPAEESDPTFHSSAPALQQCLILHTILYRPIGARGCCHRYALTFELRSLLRVRPIGVVPEEMSREGGLQECVQTLNVVPVAGDLLNECDVTTRGEDQMLTGTAEPALQRGAVSNLTEATQALLLSLADRSTDIDRMGVDYEKGGLPSPSSSQNTFDSCFISGVRIARRSAQFCRVSRRGNKRRMTG